LAEALAPDEIREAVDDNLTNLGLDVLDVVNLRVGGLDSPTPDSIAEPFRVLAEMQRAGLIKHLGVSNVTAEQIAEAQSIALVVCVQNFYNIANRRDDALIDSLAEQGLVMCRSSRSAVLHPCNPKRCRTSLLV
jgi:pyridoxine 4-dehydrogenase